MTQFPIGPTQSAPAGVVRFERHLEDDSTVVIVQAAEAPLWWYPASVAVPQAPAADGCFWCRNWDEAWRVCDAFLEAGIAEFTGRIVELEPFCVAHEMRIVHDQRAHVQAYKAHIGEPERVLDTTKFDPWDEPEDPDFDPWHVAYCAVCDVGYDADESCACH